MVSLFVTLPILIIAGYFILRGPVLLSQSEVNKRCRVLQVNDNDARLWMSDFPFGKNFLIPEKNDDPIIDGHWYTILMDEKSQIYMEKIN